MPGVGVVGAGPVVAGDVVPGAVVVGAVVVGAVVVGDVVPGAVVAGAVVVGAVVAGDVVVDPVVVDPESAPLAWAVPGPALMSTAATASVAARPQSTANAPRHGTTGVCLRNFPLRWPVRCCLRRWVRTLGPLVSSPVHHYRRL